MIAPFNNSASNKHFWLRRLTDNGLQAATNIEANTPYIISMPNSEEYTSDYNLNGRVTFSAQNIDVPATTTKVLALADSSIVMVPAMQRQSRSSSVLSVTIVQSVRSRLILFIVKRTVSLLLAMCLSRRLQVSRELKPLTVNH